MPALRGPLMLVAGVTNRDEALVGLEVRGCRTSVRCESHGSSIPEPGKEEEEGDEDLPDAAKFVDERPGGVKQRLPYGPSAEKLVETRTKTLLPVDTPVMTSWSRLLRDLP